jgi:predicted polyphosphate/ATP-dependent NAD kinase
MKIGFLVNPIAGMGGRVGLKGTDNVLDEAYSLGAKPVSPAKALEFLRRLKELDLEEEISLLTCPSVMGAEEARMAGLKSEILPMDARERTSAEDTKMAVRLMVDKGVDLMVFVGGDGTARDIFDALGRDCAKPVLGVPSGVKMYSGVFAASVFDAADVVQGLLNGEAQIMDFEIVDVDEEAFRRNRLSTKLYGFLKGPFVPMHSLTSKQISPETLDEHENQMAVAKFLVEDMNPDATYIFGPGTTVKCVADLLGIEKTLLGVDIYRNGQVSNDVNEEKILREIREWSNTWIVLSPIGRQGMLLGRGNQQISAEVIKRVGRDHLIVAATKNKIRGIDGGVLRVDTGNPEIDESLRGYIKVATDYREWRLMQII